MHTTATQQSFRSKAGTVHAVSLHAAIVLASLIAASVTLVAGGPGVSQAHGAPGAGGLFDNGAIDPTCETTARGLATSSRPG
jgi:hypothetical protein